MELVSWDFLKLSQFSLNCSQTRLLAIKPRVQWTKSIIDNNVKHMIQKCPTIRNGLNKNSMSIYGILGRHLKGCLEGYEMTWKGIYNPFNVKGLKGRKRVYNSI